MTFIYVVPLQEEYNGYGHPENGGYGNTFNFLRDKALCVIGNS